LSILSIQELNGNKESVDDPRGCHGRILKLMLSVIKSRISLLEKLVTVFEVAQNFCHRVTKIVREHRGRGHLPVEAVTRRLVKIELNEETKYML
jgi:hypothetical protein